MSTLDLKPEGRTQGQYLDEVLARFAKNAEPGELFLGHYELNADRTVRCFKMGTPPAPNAGSHEAEVEAFRIRVRAEKKRADEAEAKLAEVNTASKVIVETLRDELAALKSDRERLMAWLLETQAIAADLTGTPYLKSAAEKEINAALVAARKSAR